MTEQEIRNLYQKYKQKTCSYKELEAWFSALQDPDSRARVEQWIEADWDQENITGEAEAADIDWDFMFAKIIRETAAAEAVPVQRRSGGLVLTWKMAAAAVLLLVAGATVFYLLNKTNPEQSLAKKQEHHKTQTIVPGHDGAILTLADGSQIVLDSVQNGVLAREGNTHIAKVNGQLVYNSGEPTGMVAYNTMTTPRGRKYQLTLVDGSKVWLNAASSITFPTAFIEDHRRVEVTGEAYFEVVHNAAKPFIVAVNGMEVQVLGTRFNINAYPDENAVKTTLLQGRVKVKKGAAFAYLQPGQQAQWKGQGNMTVLPDVDLDEVMAWKNGRFLFNGSTIETILRQAARWYDVNFVYKGEVAQTFSGNLDRSENIQQLLKIMEATGKVTFSINGKEILVKPK